MELKELSKNEIVIEWFDTIEARGNTQRNYLASMRKYTDFTGMTPDELLTDAETEIESGTLMRKRNIKKMLVGFNKHLDDIKLAPNTKKSLMTGVRSFYSSFDIDIPKKLRKVKDAKTLPENQRVPTKQDIHELLKFTSIRTRAIILCQTSSGMGQNEILNLKVGDFSNGYDPVTGITTLHLRRMKVNYDFITFLSPEASDAVNNYLDYRHRTPQSIGIRHENEIIKHRVNGPDDYLFISETIPEKYLTTLDEDDRKLATHGFMDAYRVLARAAGKGTETGEWQYIRSHNMRKFFNSTLLNEGADSFMVEFLMGHKIDKTREAYFRADPDKMRKLYMRYLPFLAVDDTEVRVVETAEFIELKKENEQMKRDMEEISDMVAKMEKHGMMKTPDPSKLEELKKSIVDEMLQKMKN